MTALLAGARPSHLRLGGSLAAAESGRDAAAVERDIRRRAAAREAGDQKQSGRMSEEMSATPAEATACPSERWGYPFESIVDLIAATADEPDDDNLREHLRRIQEIARVPDDAIRSLFDMLRIYKDSERPAPVPELA